MVLARLGTLGTSAPMRCAPHQLHPPKPALEGRHEASHARRDGESRGLDGE